MVRVVNCCYNSFTKWYTGVAVCMLYMQANTLSSSTYTSISHKSINRYVVQCTVYRVECKVCNV